MKKVILYISGNIQRVGYRAKVVSIAKALGVKGLIQNLPDGRVKIIAQGEQSDLDKLIKDINISNSLINVINIEQEYSTPSDEYEGFNKVVGEGETDERMDNAVDLFKELITITKDGFNNLGDKIDRVGDKVDKSRIEITSEIHSLRDDFNAHFDTKILKIESELTEIKDRVMVLESSSSYNFTDKKKT